MLKQRQTTLFRWLDSNVCDGEESSLSPVSFRGLSLVDAFEVFGGYEEGEGDEEEDDEDYEEDCYCRLVLHDFDAGRCVLRNNAELRNDGCSLTAGKE